LLLRTAIGRAADVAGEFDHRCYYEARVRAYSKGL
jgi:hypothetical protein